MKYFVVIEVNNFLRPLPVTWKEVLKLGHCWPAAAQYIKLLSTRFKKIQKTANDLDSICEIRPFQVIDNDILSDFVRIWQLKFWQNMARSSNDIMGAFRAPCYT